ncbi:PREDICTED: uncharacterized protein LOC109232346 isoform X2 [Nicotiana attenuata]|uniref:uncharacterized protein LOC109232346 isoform X2 n=1 Tax=Nicotiana attenuata TaxID=49451 RepID=UPI0009048593|nr:PREDICTED: uncharacterized protein LOC109232346 isoform X2 [Nicotiana attenuata]
MGENCCLLQPLILPGRIAGVNPISLLEGHNYNDAVNKYITGMSEDQDFVSEKDLDHFLQLLDGCTLSSFSKARQT